MSRTARTNLKHYETQAALSLKGGVERVIDSATGDIAQTGNGAWIEDEKYGVLISRAATSISTEFDSAVTRTGRLTLKLSATDITGKAVAYNGLGSGATNTVSNLTKYGIPVKPSTSYIMKVYAKSTNAPVNGIFVNIATYDVSGTRKETAQSNKLTGTADWTLLTTAFTTGATSVFFTYGLNNATAGNISDAWFDVNSMTLEEVSTITNSGASPAQFYPKVTAVSSTDNIDQSQVTSNQSVYLGDNGGSSFQGQTFTPTKSKFQSFVFVKTGIFSN